MRGGFRPPSCPSGLISGCGPRCGAVWPASRPFPGPSARPPVLLACSCAAPLPGLHRFRLFDARQLAAVEVGQPVARLRQRQAGELLIERVMPAGLIDHDKAVAPIAVREHQALTVERRLERLAAVRLLEAIQDGRADFPHVRSEAAAFLELVAVGGARPVVRLSVVAKLAQGKILLDRPRQLFQVELEQAGIDALFASGSKRNHAT